MIKLYPHQDEVYQPTIEALPKHTAILISAACGFGKSVLIAHLANTIPNRTLVLTHRKELLEQNSQLITDHAVLDAKTKKPQILKDAKVVVCMAQTIIRRIEKNGPDYAGEFDTIIIDECHLDFFEKVYTKIPHKNRIGLTATPCVNKVQNKNIDGIDYTRKATLRDEYDHLIQGISEKKLIDLGYLVRDFNIQLTPPKLEDLKNSNSNPDGYTSKSLTEVFGSNASIETVISGYTKFCKDKTTVIFNPTTAVNKKMYEAFLKLELPVKMFDSVNKVKGQTREDVVNWFRNTPGAILLNVGVFTTGFDAPELEAIIFNRKTKSLGLFLQIAGRGSRTSKKILKDKFLLLDLGLNIAEHGTWSEERDWSKFFIDNPWKKKRETDLLQMWECKECGYFNLQGEYFNNTLERIECQECHEPKPKPKEKKLIKGEFVVLEEPICPNAGKLIEYALRCGGDANMVLKLCRNQIVDLFKYHTSKTDFEERKSRYYGRIAQLYRPTYFAILNHPELKGKNRKLTTEIEKVIEMVEEFYK